MEREDGDVRRWKEVREVMRWSWGRKREDAV